jgi:predicted enzyme related to lactoylglutathione lyase
MYAEPGQIVWRELAARDVAQAKRFYAGLFDWKYESTQRDGIVYTRVASPDGRLQGGFFPLVPGLDMHAYWASYVLVDSADAAAERVLLAGGSVLALHDLDDIGRICTFKDPEGAIINGMQPWNPLPAAPEDPGLGGFTWEALATGAPEAAARFYERVFGWIAGAGPLDGSIYFNAGMMPIGHLQTLPAGIPPSWTTYVMVGDVERAKARAIELGGQVVDPSVEAGHYGKVALVCDPDGTVFGLYESA